MRRPVLAATAGAVLAATLGACVGPNFHRPTPPKVERFTAEPLPAATTAAPGPDGAAQRFLSDAELPRRWWTLFGSAPLDALVDQALAANPSVHAAQAALRQANELTAAQRGSFLPAVQAGFDASRQQQATGVLAPNLASGASIYNLYTPQVTVTYVPDLFGANRRLVEALAAQAEMSRFQLEATYLTLAANVVAAAIQEAGLRAQIAATTRVVDLEREALAVMRRELELGAIAEADVYAQDAALANLETTLPPLQRQWQQTRDLLAALTGRLPANYDAAPLDLDDLTLPQDLPLGVPSRLVERRPDVRAAEAALHSATASVGVAIADLLPQVTLTGTVGSSATAMSDLFKAGTGFWSVGASAAQTLFAGGTLLHRKRAADAALEQAAATYKATVLTAFQNVADALHALGTDADALRAAARAADAAEKSLSVARRQLELGSVSYLGLLTAEQADQQALVTLAQARAARLADTAALFQALGGSLAPAGR